MSLENKAVHDMLTFQYKNMYLWPYLAHMRTSNSLALIKMKGGMVATISNLGSTVTKIQIESLVSMHSKHTLKFDWD